MVETVMKFKMETRDWPYVVEFERHNEATNKPELLTWRTGSQPKGALLKAAKLVARLALEFHGLRVITDADGSIRAQAPVSFDLASVTWSEGDVPGSKVEVFLVSPIALEDTEMVSDLKLPLQKVDRFDETRTVTEGGLRMVRSVENSVKDEYNAAVKQLRDLVKDFAQGGTEQGELFTETQAAAQ